MANMAGDVPAFARTVTDRLIMTRDDFWRLIDCVDRDALDDGDEEEAVRPLQDRLSSLTVPNLEAFEEHLSLCLHALDGQVYADESGEAGRSDDGFLYARCYVVARGRDHYDATL